MKLRNAKIFFVSFHLQAISTTAKIRKLIYDDKSTCVIFAKKKVFLWKISVRQTHRYLVSAWVPETGSFPDCYLSISQKFWLHVFRSAKRPNLGYHFVTRCNRIQSIKNVNSLQRHLLQPIVMLFREQIIL